MQLRDMTQELQGIYATVPIVPALGNALLEFANYPPSIFLSG